MTEEERLELERLRDAQKRFPEAAGQRAMADYEAMVNAPSNNVNIPVLNQIDLELQAMPTVDQAAPAVQQLPTANEVALPQQGVTLSSRDFASSGDAGYFGSQQEYGDKRYPELLGNLKESPLVQLLPSDPITAGDQEVINELIGMRRADQLEAQGLSGLRQGGARNLSEALNVPMPVTNVGLTGEPLRKQPSVEQIRHDSRPGRLAGKDLETKERGFIEGIKNIFTDSTGKKLEAEKYAPRNQPLDIVPSGNTMRTATPEDISRLGGLFNMADTLSTPQEAGQRMLDMAKFYPGAFMPATEPVGQAAPIELEPLVRNDTPEATFLRADGSIGEIFPGQRIGDAFPGNPDTPLVGSPLVPGQQTYQGVDLPGGTGFVRAPEGMVKTIGPDGRMIFTTPEQANTVAPAATSPTATAPTTAEGSTAPEVQQSRLSEFGEMVSNNADRILDFARPHAPGVTGVIDAIRGFDDAKSAAKTGLDYLTDPRQPSFKTLADERAAAGVIPQGQPGSIQDNFVKRMATGEPLTQAETAAAIEFARFNKLNFDPRVGYSQAPMARGPQVTATAPRAMTMEFRATNQDGIEDRVQGIFRPGDFRGSGPIMLPRVSGANLPTLSSVNAMSGMAPQNRPALSAYEQASMDREARMAARDRLPGETQTQRDTRIAQSRTQGSSQGGLSQADARDLAQGSARGATEGERMRALQIQSRLGLGAFKPGTPRVDKLSQATSTVDRMIQNGQLSPEKRNAAIQRIMGLGSGSGTGTSADAGVIGSAEFDRISSQLQPGGALHREGIRVDPSRVDPNTGAALIYKENDGGYLGFSFEEPVSPELIQQLLPYARALRKPGVGDFAGMGMAVNQFAGSI